MTETTCPTCGAKCMVMQTRCTCNTPTCVHTERMYRALPQPDLTKLREAFKKYIITATRKDFNLISLCKDIDNLIRIVKEVLDGQDNQD